jgi:flagellar biogenesis protein FliO
MPMTHFIRMNPWNLSLVLGLALGVCLFQPSWASKAYALDADSQLFEQNQNSGKTQPKSSQPLALPEETPNPSPSLFATFLRLLVALAVIVGLIFLTVWGLKLVWEKRGWNQLTDEGKPIKILSSTYLAPRKTIHLVEVGKRILVVGVGNEEMNCLDVIREPEEVEALRGSAPQGFPKIFNRIIQRHETASQKEETQRMIKESSQAVGDYVAKLKKMKKKKNTDESLDGES